MTRAGASLAVCGLVAGCTAREVRPPPQGIPAPVAVGRIVDVQSGNFHSCALLADRTVRCWGMNDHGQLGDGTTTNRNVAVAVTGLDRVAAIALDGSTSCAIVDDGAVRCWGDLTFLLGTQDHPATAPVEIPALRGATQLSLGFAHSCARAADGTARCDGDPEEGGTVAGLGDVVEVAAAYALSCARKADGTVWCWGFDWHGVVGRDLGTADRTAVPGRVVGLDHVVQLGGGSGFMCARTADGAVRCWGDGGFGHLGDGRDDDELHPSPARVAHLPRAASLAVGGDSACAIGVDGTAWCWGKDTPGDDAVLFAACADVGIHSDAGYEGGVEYFGPSEAYCKRPARLPLAHVTAVAPGSLHICALAAGVVSCWGSNYYGALGDGSPMDTSDHSDPRPVQGL